MWARAGEGLELPNHASTDATSFLRRPLSLLGYSPLARPTAMALPWPQPQQLWHGHRRAIPELAVTALSPTVAKNFPRLFFDHQSTHRSCV